MAAPTTLAELLPLEHNPRVHNSRNISVIAEALHRVGPARSGVIDEDNVLLAGNGTAEALAQAGITKVRVIDGAPDEWVVVRVNGLSPQQKRLLTYADNRAGELAGWLAEEVVADVAGGIDLTQAQVFNAAEVEAFIFEAERADRESYEFLDEQPTPRPRGQAGDQVVDPDPAAAPARGQAAEGARFPLAIVLTRAEATRWQTYKKRIDKADDKAAFLLLLDSAEE